MQITNLSFNTNKGETVNFFNGRNTIVANELSYLKELKQEEVNNIAIGPQELFYQKLESINCQLRHYDIEQIDVTPKWNWRPGTYDRIKEYLHKRLDMHKKSKNVEYLIERTHSRASYLNYIHRQAMEMETERYNLKRLGVSKNVDIVKFQEECTTFVNNINTQCDLAHDMSEGHVDIKPIIYIKDRIVDFYLDIKLYELEMNIFDGKESSKSIQKIALQPIHIIINLNFRHLLNKMSITPAYYGIYEYNDNISVNFPYISSGRYSDRTAYGSVCFDRYLDDIKKSIRKSDYVVLAMNLMQWAQYYHIKISNPYQSIHNLHIGLPKSYSKEYKMSVSSDNITYSCKPRIRHYLEKKYNDFIERNVEGINLCNDLECSLTNECNLYLKHKRQLKLYEEISDMIESVVGFIQQNWYDANFNNLSISSASERITGNYVSPTDENFEELVYSNLVGECVKSSLKSSYLVSILTEYGYWKGAIESKVKVDSTDINAVKLLMKTWAIDPERSSL